MQITIKSVSGKKINIDLATLTASLADTTITGKFMGPLRFFPAEIKNLPEEFKDATHFININDTRVAIDEETAKAVRDADFDCRSQKIKNARVELLKKVEGLDLIEDAYYRRNKYFDDLNAMMEDEGNDGVFAPTAPKKDEIDKLEKEYPVAAIYYKADNYSAAENDEKAKAGTLAKQIILETGNIAEAEALLKNWHTHCFID